MPSLVSHPEFRLAPAQAKVGWPTSNPNEGKPGHPWAYDPSIVRFGSTGPLKTFEER